MMNLDFTTNTLLVTSAIAFITWLTRQKANRIFVSWNQATLA